MISCQVMVDVTLRSIQDLPPSDMARAEYVRLLQHIIQYSQWQSEGQYRAAELWGGMQHLFNVPEGDIDRT